MCCILPSPAWWRLVDLDMKQELCGPQGALELECTLRKSAPEKKEEDDDDYKTKLTDEL